MVRLFVTKRLYLKYQLYYFILLQRFNICVRPNYVLRLIGHGEDILL